MNQQLLKDTMKGAAPNLGVLALIIVIIMLFHPSFLVLAGLLLVIQAAKTLYAARKEGWSITYTTRRFIKEAVVLSLVVTTLYFLNEWLGAWGWLGLLLLCVIIAAWIIIKKWQTYLYWIREIEQMVFGETAEERKERRKNGRPRP